MNKKITKIAFALTLLAAQFSFLNFALAQQATFTPQLSLSSGPYALGQGSLNVYIYIPPTQTNSSYTNISATIKTYVNANLEGTINTTLSQLTTNSTSALGNTYQTIPVATQSGFAAGSNSIDVLITDANGDHFNTNTITFNVAGTVGSAQFSVDKNTANIGDTVNASFTNMPSGGWSVLVAVNSSTTITCSSAVCPIVLSTANGATDNSANTLTIIKAFDSSNNPITIQPTTQTITIGTATQNTCTPACTGGQTCQNGTCQAAGTGMSGNSTTQLYNPLPEQDLTHVFLLILQGFLAIIGIWAVIFIVIGGFQMITAAGNEEMYTKAKKTIIWAILGLVIALMSFSIIAIVQDILQSNIKSASTSPAKIVRYL
ncbi:MAG: pilin [Candidatus Doudnabacteria bacterium]|nr:pilin [Candidatus Doudnabacteria bacterium]